MLDECRKINGSGNEGIEQTRTEEQSLSYKVLLFLDHAAFASLTFFTYRNNPKIKRGAMMVTSE